MSLTISNSRSIFQQPTKQQPSKIETASKPTSPSSTSVTLSDDAKILWQQEQVVKPTELSNAELKALHDRTEGPDTWMDQLVRQMNEQGKNAPALKELPATTDTDRLAIARQAAEFVYSVHTTRSQTGSPYHELSREALNDIIYDESGAHTDAERRAAFITRHDNDENYKAHLFAQPDQRVVFQGILDYFDALSPVEQSIYPEDHRETWQRLLEQEEAQSGKLRPDFNLWELFMDKPPRTDVLFPSLNRPRSEISASPSAPPPSPPLPRSS